MKFTEFKQFIVNVNKIISESAKVSEMIGHDPFKGHTPDASLENSTFYDEVDLTEDTEYHSALMCERDNIKIYGLVFDDILVGDEVFTSPNKTDIKATVVHTQDGLKLKSSDFHLNYTTTGYISLILTKHDSGWMLESVYPGVPGIDVGAELQRLNLREGDEIKSYDLSDYPRGMFDHVILDK